jgi:hypothetical protein
MPVWRVHDVEEGSRCQVTGRIFGKVVQCKHALSVRPRGPPFVRHRRSCDVTRRLIRWEPSPRLDRIASDFLTYTLLQLHSSPTHRTEATDFVSRVPKRKTSFSHGLATGSAPETRVTGGSNCWARSLCPGANLIRLVALMSTELEP